ncbi:putative isochorismatase hydrolase [Streptomyces sp. Tu6071]|nr:cysteine hydrolase [Streptomyces sp. CLI2509]EGJ79134.1 putative isochorismatase hydrolase [Streptomyces sp. Tu6071]MYX22475.1 isochorismatase family protein [Streptomyces sp. SID8380]
MTGDLPGGTVAAMTAFAHRPGTALLVVDMQNGVVAHAHRGDEVVATLAGLVARARAEGVPVVWVRHQDEALVPGTPAWQLVPALVPLPGEPVLGKEYADAFEATELEEVLAAAGVGRIVVTGAATDVCVRSTLHGGFARGYDTVLVSDAHTTEDTGVEGVPGPAAIIAHTNLYWSQQVAPGRVGGTAEAADVVLGAG